MLSECWAPCFKLNSGYLRLETAAKMIAIYTGLIHVVLMFYSIFIIMGGSSDTFFSPFFEFNRKTMTTLAIVLIIYCVLYIFTCSYWLVKGVKTETRFYYLPWLNLTAFEMFFMLFYSFFMIYRYYHNGWSFFAAIIYWSALGYHFYLYLVVLSLYRYVKKIQEPTIVMLHNDPVYYPY